MAECNVAKLDSMFEAFSILGNGAYVYVSDIKADYSRWSKAAVNYFGLPSEYMEQAGYKWMERIHPDDQARYKENIESLFRGEIREHNLQYRVKVKDDTYIVCTCKGVVITDENGNPEYFGGCIKNNDSLGYIDDITGFRSLYGFLEDLKADSWHGQKIQVMLIGINDFGHLNEIYGYTFGNRVMQEFAKKLEAESGNLGVWYRMDGPKFAIVCKEATEDDLRKLYKKIQHDSIHDFEVEGNRVVLSFVAGAMNIEDFDVDVETVYSCLRFAYYESKNSHMGDLVVLKNSVYDDKHFAIERINEIRNCIVDGCKGFFLCYQPIVDAGNERVVGAEALIRWKSETHGIVPPVQFVDLLEQDNLFPKLGKWILETALKDGKKFIEKYPDFVMNVNLSYTQIEKDDFVDMVLGLLMEYNFPPQNLCLEITERCRLLDVKLLKDVFMELRRHGIKVALDDFGTGFSSLGILRELPVTTVKIDRGFVMNIETSPSDQKTVRFISELADSFDATVCAEGIETSEMREFLLRFKIRSLQGFFYSKPLPFDEFMKKYITAEN